MPHPPSIMNSFRGCEKIKLLSSPLATLPKWFAASQSFSPYGLNSWAAITWLAYTKQLFGIPGALFGRERNACGRRPGHHWSSKIQNIVADKKMTISGLRPAPEWFAACCSASPSRFALQAAITWLILTNSLRHIALRIGYERKALKGLSARRDD